MELTIQVNPVERTVRLREVHALAAGDSCSVVLEGVRGADVASLRLALYRDAASDSPVASCPSFAPVRGHPNLATGDLRLDTAEMAAWFEAVRPEPEGSATDRDGSGSGDTAERAVRTDGWLVVSEPTRTWAACRVPVVLRPGAGVSGVVDPTSIQSLVEGLVSAAMSEALALKADKATTLAGYGITDAATKTELDEVGQRAANAILGVQSELSTKADLVDGKVPANQLPSFVDDVLEYDDISAFPATGEDGKIYVAKDTNKTYRWGGTQYVEISQSLALGETSETAYPGDKGKAAAETAANALMTADSAYTVAGQAMHDIAVHSENKENPHAVTAAQVGALPLVDDVNGKKTAVTIGSRKSGGTVGQYSLANGRDVTASGEGSHAEGLETVASGVYSRADGMFTEALGTGSYAFGYKSKTLPSHRHAFVWNGYGVSTQKYLSHDEGTFNINPFGGLGGFYIGEKTLADIFYTKDEVDATISATNTTFSNAVLAVGLNIDTNSVAVLNEIAETFGGFPIEGTATTVGGLLAALAAAVAWLKKNKADKATTLAGYGITDAATMASLAPEYSPSSAYAVGSFVFHDGNIYQCTTAIVDGGEAWNAAHWEMRKLDDFFTESNSLLTGTIDARIPYPFYSVPSTGLLKDRAINTTSLASVTVPDNFTDLLIRASVASSLSVTMPEAITTKYGDTFPGEAGEYLITITKTGTAEAYVRTIKMEVANA